MYVTFKTEVFNYNVQVYDEQYKHKNAIDDSYRYHSVDKNKYFSKRWKGS